MEIAEVRPIKIAQLNGYCLFKTQLQLHSVPLMFYFNVCCNIYRLRLVTEFNYIDQCTFLENSVFICVCVTGGGGPGGSKECDQ